VAAKLAASEMLDISLGTWTSSDLESCLLTGALAGVTPNLWQEKGLALEGAETFPLQIMNYQSVGPASI